MKLSLAGRSLAGAPARLEEGLWGLWEPAEIAEGLWGPDEVAEGLWDLLSQQKSFVGAC